MSGEFYKVDDEDCFAVSHSGKPYALVRDAEFAETIIHCLNCHDDLLEALDSILSWDWGSLRRMPDHIDWHAALQCLESAREAKDKAEAQS